MSTLGKNPEKSWGITVEEMDDYIWTWPEIVAEIKFTEWTQGDLLRHAEFAVLREDKDPKEVQREVIA